jgi:hypothetical protein
MARLTLPSNTETSVYLSHPLKPGRTAPSVYDVPK